jgi:DNA polymerase
MAKEIGLIIRALREDLSYRNELGFIEVVPLPFSFDPTPFRRECTILTKTHPLSPGDKKRLLEELKGVIGDCTRCKLHTQRKNIVFGVGNPDARLVFVGEGPGRDEDLQGEPFVGKAGQLLTKIIQAIGLKREDVYIANIVKCRPPENRNPQPDEIKTCEPFLFKQLEIIKPNIICALGNFAAQTLLMSSEKITNLRGKFHNFRGIKLMPTYHPAFLLRNPDMKRDVWEDMKMVQKEYFKSDQ